MSNTALLWPSDRTERLKKLYAAGLSCSQIAAELNCGLTRNAVIGKVHRLKLKRRGFTAARWGAYSAETKPGALPPPISLNVTFADIGAFQCRWITTEQPVLFCGHPALVGSWCPAHRAIVFKPRTVNRRLEALAA